MKPTTFGAWIVATAITVTSVGNLAASEPDSSSDAAKRPLELYVLAQQTGNGQYIRQAFAKDARIIGNFNGAMINWSVDEYVARFSGKPADDEAKRVRSTELISVTRDAAVGKVVLDYPAILFTDYMALIKIEGEWKIVSKSFNALQKQTQK
jgi:hypothetical protein